MRLFELCYVESISMFPQEYPRPATPVPISHVVEIDLDYEFSSPPPAPELTPKEEHEVDVEWVARYIRDEGLERIPDCFRHLELKARAYARERGWLES
jgi:hypothetical protein